MPDDAEDVGKVAEPDALPTVVGLAGQRVDGGEEGGVMDGQVPDGTGGHGVADEIDAGGVDVGLVRGVEDRLHHQVHADGAGAVKLIQIQQRHDDHRIGMTLQFILHPAGVNLADRLRVRRRVGEKRVGDGKLYHQGPGMGAVILRGNSEEIADAEGADLFVDEVDAGSEVGPAGAQADDPADDGGGEAGGLDFVDQALALGLRGSAEILLDQGVDILEPGQWRGLELVA